MYMILHAATNNKSNNLTCCVHYFISYFLKFQSPDIYIDDKDNINHLHRDGPYTSQSKGCGQPGDQMNIPFNHLTSNESNPKVLVSEWAKLRYGIFDEFGFPNDPLYPHYYRVKDQVRPTGADEQASQWSVALPK